VPAEARLDHDALVAHGNDDEFGAALREQRLWGQGRALFAPSAKVAKQSAMFWEERLHGIRGPT